MHFTQKPVVLSIVLALTVIFGGEICEYQNEFWLLQKWASLTLKHWVLASKILGNLMQMLHGAMIARSNHCAKILQIFQKIFSNLAKVQAKDFARWCKSGKFARDCKQSCKDVQPDLLAEDFACQHAVVTLLRKRWFMTYKKVMNKL